MKKIFLAVIVSISFISCRPSANEVTDEDMKAVINFFLNNIVENANHINGYLLSPILENGLNAEMIESLIAVDNVNKKDLAFMYNNHKKYVNAELNKFIEPKFLSKIQYEKPKNNEIYYVIDPPLFTRNKKIILVYARTIFQVDGTNRWDQLVFLIKKDGSNYIFADKIKID